MGEDFLSPEDVDFRGSEDVYGLGDGRYVVRTEEDDRAWEEKRHQKITVAEPAPSSTTPPPVPFDFGGIWDPYAVQVALKTDTGVDEFITSSDDLQEVFVEMLRWYAARVEPALPPERVVEVLLKGTEFDR